MERSWINCKAPFVGIDTLSELKRSMEEVNEVLVEVDVTDIPSDDSGAFLLKTESGREYVYLDGKPYRWPAMEETGQLELFG